MDRRKFYIFRVSPEHAMGPKYIIVVVPLIFVVVAQILKKLLRFKVFYLVIVVLVVASQITYGILDTFSRIKSAKNSCKSFDKSTVIPIILDSEGMGVLPTYHQVGITAPLLLLLFRILQGIMTRFFPLYLFPALFTH